MFDKTRTLLMMAATALPLMASQAWADGLISIIVTDPANPCDHSTGRAWAGRR